MYIEDNYTNECFFLSNAPNKNMHELRFPYRPITIQRIFSENAIVLVFVGHYCFFF